MRGQFWVAPILISCLIGNLQLRASQTSDTLPRPIIIGNVLTAFDLCKRQAVIPIAVSDMAHWGDDVSASLLRGIDARELATPENIKAYVCLARMAFSSPKSMPLREDEVPGVTLLLLEYLRMKTDDKALIPEIHSAEDYAKKQNVVYVQSPDGRRTKTVPPPTNVGNALSAFQGCKSGFVMTSLGMELARRRDDALASLLRGINPKELATPENTRAYICLVRQAFRMPSSMPLREDRVPGVTFLLLEYLKMKTDDKALVMEIDSSEDYVKSQTLLYLQPRFEGSH